MTIKYKSTGVVLGYLWGGGCGQYPAIELSSEISEKDLIEQAETALANGKLDAGMGFESLKGALLCIEITRDIIFEDRIYSNVEYVDTIIGDFD